MKIEKRTLERFKLSLEEIYNVLSVVDNQVEKSRRDGLVIGENDLVLEKFCFLCMLEQWGGIEMAKTNLGIEKVEKDIDDRIEKLFKPFNLESNIKTEKEKEKNQQKYLSHLEAVKKGIISLIFENKI